MLRRQPGLEAKVWMLSGVVAIATTLAYVTLVAPLGAATRAHAVALALQRGEITP